jgi:hypothetical protein
MSSLICEMLADFPHKCPSFLGHLSAASSMQSPQSLTSALPFSQLPCRGELSFDGCIAREFHLVAAQQEPADN